MNLDLVEVLRYNAWANRTLLEACRELTEEQLDARLPVASGSVASFSFTSSPPNRRPCFGLVGASTRAS
jgi:hypothetical protein